jgi:hypothetical protein
LFKKIGKLCLFIITSSLCNLISIISFANVTAKVKIELLFTSIDEIKWLTLFTADKASCKLCKVNNVRYSEVFLFKSSENVSVLQKKKRPLLGGVRCISMCCCTDDKAFRKDPGLSNVGISIGQIFVVSPVHIIVIIMYCEQNRYCADWTNRPLPRRDIYYYVFYSRKRPVSFLYLQPPCV